jgi:putative Mg2+ transporter-C (MgtC) family protein
MTDHWEMMDLYKALMSTAAGLILGLERELKDKAAGLKTITIICLGATLFAIISYKVGGPENTRIASYIVSGVGFLGAGVIFKDGFTVSGLTTAGIIWLAAAIGTSIGFGEFYMAATFLAVSLLVIFIATPLINKLFVPQKQTRQLQFEISKKEILQKDRILTTISEQGILVEEKKIEMKDDLIIVTAEVVVKNKKMKWLQEYLSSIDTILSYSV